MSAEKAGESPAVAEPQPQNAGSPLRNAKHEAVLQGYIADAERVGYRCYIRVYRNSGEAAARTAFSRLLKNADFTARLRVLDADVTAKVVEKAAVTIEQVVTELCKLGFANMENYMRAGADGVPRLKFSDLTSDQKAALQEVTCEEEIRPGDEDEEATIVRKTKFKLYNKEAALVDILRHLGGFPAQKHELTGADGGPMKVDVDAEGLSELELGRRIAFALEKAARAPRPASEKTRKK